MHVTVAICTWNRSRLLDAALGAFAKLEIPSGVDWDLIVVDNRCTDDTPAVVERWARSLPVRREFEERQGQSFARNLALDVARGELLIWTDDDVRVDPQWIAAYARAAARDPEAAFYGGPVAPDFAVSPPAWVRDNLDVFASALALRGDAPGDDLLADARHLPFGANFALRTALCAGRRFDTTLGHKGAILMGGEEVAFLEGLLAAGHHGRWVHDARVHHHIPAERTTRRFFWDYYHGNGRARARAGVAGDPRGLRRKLWKARLRLVGSALRRDARWARAFKSLATAKGSFDELRGGAARAGSAEPPAARPGRPCSTSS